MYTYDDTESQAEKMPYLVGNQRARRFIEDATVFVVGKEPSGALRHLGSGVLFQAEDRYFLVTAQHILEGYNPEKIFVHWGQASDSLYQIGKCHHSYPEDRKLDVAVVEFLHSETIASLKESAHFVTTRHIGRPDPRTTAHVCGFPEELVTPNGKGAINAQRYLHRSTFRDTVEVEEDALPVPGEFFLNYAREGVSERGPEVKTPELDGMSGGGIWQISLKNRGIWTPDADVRLVGVQHAYKHSQYIRAMSWSIVYFCFDSLAPGIAQGIRDALLEPEETDRQN